MGATAVAAGVDTWSPAWYLEPGSALACELGQRATVKTRRGYLLPDEVGEHRVGWMPGVSMLWAEGHPQPGALASPDALPGHLARLTKALAEAGVLVPEGDAGPRRAGFAGVRRLDSTVDLRFDSAAEGLATLAGVAGLLRDAPGLKLDVIYATDGQALETVYLRGRQYAARWYDKGAESREAVRGTWIRPEDQRRFVKATRRGVEELHTEYVKTKFKQRFHTLWEAAKGVTVAGVPVLAEKLDELIETGELTPRQGETLAGYLLLGGRGLPASTARKRRKTLRQYGLVLQDGVMQEVEINLQDVMEELMETPAWQG